MNYEDQVLEQLRAAKAKSGLSYEEIGTRMGVHLTAVRRMLNGDHSPTLRTLAKYLEALNLRLTFKLDPKGPSK